MQPKADFRRAIRDRLIHLSAKDREIESRVLCKQLRSILGTTPATIAAFLPYSDEPDITPLLLELLSAGWSIAMPALEHNHLAFRIIKNLTQMKIDPVTRIPKPDDDCEPADEALIAMAIVPGRAFTITGDRMGRGNGGYDIWIGKQRAKGANTTYIGVCFECQIVPELPMEAHDQKIDSVVTARGKVTAFSE